jgi:hypothetical protein
VNLGKVGDYEYLLYLIQSVRVPASSAEPERRRKPEMKMTALQTDFSVDTCAAGYKGDVTVTLDQFPVLLALGGCVAMFAIPSKRPRRFFLCFDEPPIPHFASFEVPGNTGMCV